MKDLLELRLWWNLLKANTPILRKSTAPNYRHLRINANKAFKSDSQRLVCFIPSLGFVFMVVCYCFVVALLTP
ncbi:hypothetical protein DA098_28290 [Vibrio parahaemolyticus]|nr:hypothetical protein DA098_28290 [Vibrio parahaemolyticus]TMX76824.1 hypothetical protein DA094_14315 [Vibrio parahaemolyticus]